jgi:hypothetical protein
MMKSVLFAAFGLLILAATAQSAHASYVFGRQQTDCRPTFGGGMSCTTSFEVPADGLFRRLSQDL